jgi:hypothetical protein
VAIYIFFILVIVAIYYKVRFHQTISVVHNLSLHSKSDIFGVNFESAAQMRSDMTFLNKLWVGKLIDPVTDESLKHELNNARKFFRYQMFLGLFAVVSVVINGFITD